MDKYLCKKWCYTLNRKKILNNGAVIDIGSNNVKLTISQCRNDNIEEIEKSVYPIDLGHEAFNYGKISVEKIKELTKALKGFSNILNEYQISQTKIIATSVFREAENAAYVADQLKIQNDMTFEVLEDDEEKSLIYFDILRRLKTQKSNLGTILFSYIGTGTIGIAIYKDDRFLFSRNFPFGSLKLKEILTDNNELSDSIFVAMNEYLNTLVDRLIIPVENKNIDNIIVVGSRVNYISKFTGSKTADDNIVKISRDNFNNLYNDLQNLSVDAICRKYIMDKTNAEMFCTTVVICSHILNLTKCRNILAPEYSISNALIRQMIFTKEKSDYDKHIYDSAVSCAKVLAKQYGCNVKHFECVSRYATEIFDKLKKIHGMGTKKRLALEIACIMGDCGIFLNTNNTLLSTFNIIKDSDIYGLSEEDVFFIANTARYDEAYTPSINDSLFSNLSAKNRLAVCKLVAISSLAKALDKAQLQKFSSFSVKLQEDVLIITVSSIENVYLEKISFNRCKNFFKEVFGITPKLIVKSFDINS